MSIDIFGRLLVNSREVHKKVICNEFHLTKNGDYDIRNKKLSNVNDAIEKNDAVNLKVFKVHFNGSINENKNMRIEIKSLQNSNQKLFKHIEILEEKCAKEFDVLRDLIYEKTIYVKDTKFTRTLNK